MADNSTIEWCDATWNPVRGCSRVSRGCDNCYAIGVAHRFSWGDGLTRIRRLTSAERLVDGSNRTERTDWTGEIKLLPGELERPLKWRKPRRVFVCSGADLFHHKVPDEFIRSVLCVAAVCPQHEFLLLTKRTARLAGFFKGLQLSDLVEAGRRRGITAALARLDPAGPGYRPTWPLPNVWIGASIEDQTTADDRIPELLACPAAVHFVSAEPMLGSLDILEWLGGPAVASAVAHHHRTEHQCGGHGFEAECNECSARWGPDEPHLDWVIVGGESGGRARPFDVTAAIELVKDCQAAKIPVFVKQLGRHPMLAAGVHVNTTDSKGGSLEEFPPELRYRQSPKGKDPCSKSRSTSEAARARRSTSTT